MSLFNVVEDHINPYLSLDERFVKNRHSTFFFRAKSEAMAPLITIGDTLIVDRSLPALPNMIVIASINGELICRRLKKIKHRLTLCADHPDHPPISIQETEEGVVWGVVRSSVRELI
ncbi:MAG: S24 family peptidase [Bdellovibrionales bacterium]|jgi:DNA polymerase V|nr:S24 family peptidase [Bdellovibrionales bacterium]MBT3525769.1 S24 family peptidase [Bdellovibrionales bacterium]MBT7668375.1 S24 family peptidase [Bdellovibrionales bacterium]MBT7767295.1 S24 family peptidase [Bdellovibrionales bacterium]